MKKIVCDICGRTADKTFRIKGSRRSYSNHFRIGWDGRPWSPWEEAHLCDCCIEKLKEAARNETR